VERSAFPGIFLKIGGNQPDQIHHFSRKIMKIGLHKQNYGYSYVVYGGKPAINGYSFVPSTNLWFPGLPKYLAWVRMFSPVHRVDVYHSYNYIVCNNRPWIISFESWLPRFFGSKQNEKAWIWGLEKLAGDNCKKILPISYAAENFFFNILDYLGYPKQVFKDKTLVVMPGMVDEIKPREFDFEKDKKYKFLFVGNDIVRKGGRPLIRVFKELAKSYNIELTIVSSFNKDIVTRNDDYDLDKFENEVSGLKYVNILKNVPHHDLLNIIYPAHDVFVLPTLQDSFGFVLVEAMGKGLPIISTNQFDIPEKVSHDHNGYLINIPIDKNRRSKFLSIQSYKEKAETVYNVEKIIEKQLIEYMAKLLNNPEKIMTFGKNSQAVAKEKYSIENRNNAFNRIYESVLG
jgi:glycosyltransferase involved in cell wall biosynthesis